MGREKKVEVKGWDVVFTSESSEKGGEFGLYL
jgi:hypothetical protein